MGVRGSKVLEGLHSGARVWDLETKIWLWVGPDFMGGLVLELLYEVHVVQTVVEVPVYVSILGTAI